MGQKNQGNQAEQESQGELNEAATDALHQGREDYFMDIDRMVNEGLGGGYVSVNNGLIEESTTDTMDHPESVIQGEE
ncbi:MULTISPECIES: hypothetical protein [Paenibacillus]|uniref:DUF4025 domain-containing protein n=1 Tax=Paenibacillus radicis (ex Xue et al. 2023) TaxID=2972489 RepID=A0ABT1YUT8_9BACL|nr:hypothetical protein [Paenibacillus radicis (ex Xue et al. 2023)]MCR8636689.1 hypothetical protein [Paenibacillus radicis (ex Xue et al. 2023)]